MKDMAKEISQIDQMVIMDALADAARLWEEKATMLEAKGSKVVAATRAEMAKDARRLREEIARAGRVVLE